MKIRPIRSSNRPLLFCDQIASLARNSREQVRMHQRLELLVAGLEGLDEEEESSLVKIAITIPY